MEEKDVRRILDKRGVILDKRGRHFILARNVCEMKKKYGYNKVPQEKLQNLLEKAVKNGLDREIAEQVIKVVYPFLQ